jgi:hypothetical protein
MQLHPSSAVRKKPIWKKKKKEIFEELQTSRD